MANNLNNSIEQNSPHNKDDTEQSFVGKFKSIISNTPLSKWFRKQDDNIRSTVRRREDENDDISQMQPPAKRARFPNDYQEHNFTSVITNTALEKTVISEKLINEPYNHFPEPVAGPSGLQTQKLLNSVNNPSNSVRNVFSNDLINGHKDSDSEESTSGYSSAARLGSKEHVSQSEGSSKQPSPLQINLPNSRSLFQSPGASTNRSLFNDRTASPNLNTSLSSRRPCFNASTFGSPNLIDNTISTNKIINSPFYNGKTIYGGASAYGRKLGRSARDLKLSLKRSVHIKPINKAKDGSSFTLGKTARKILETLEQYSTPVNDAKKIPIASKRFRPDTSLLGQHVGTTPYVVKNTPSNTELQVPTVSDLLKMKQKAKLQSSTEAVRQIAKSSLSGSNTVYSPVNVSDKNQTQSKSDEVEKSKGKAKIVVQSDKPKTSAPLVSTLPKFYLNIPPVTKQIPEKTYSIEKPSSIGPMSRPSIIQESRTSPEKNKVIQRDLPVVTSQFKFSNPLIIAENLKSIVAMNDFKFSEPLSKMINTDSNSSSSTPLLKSIKEKNNGQNVIKNIFSNSNSLLDKFKPATGTWECNSCLIRNQPDKSKCIACEAPNPKLKPNQQEINKNTKPLTYSFGDKFKMPEDKWECPTCMIRNSKDCAKCVACETANPKSTLVSSSSSLAFQSKFQPPANTWECSTCLIRNKEELSKCAACETPRVSKPASSVTAPSGFQGKFLPPSNTWECSTCMIRNKEELSKCAACEAPRTLKQASFNQLANSFKAKNDEWECTVCLIRNKNDHSKCQCCEAAKPGTSLNVVVTVAEKKSPPKPKFNFGIDQKTAASFSFGIPPSATVPSLPKALVEPPVPFVEATKASSISSAPKNNTSSIPTFSFGAVPKTQEKDKPVEVVKKDENRASLPILPRSTELVKPVVPEKTEANSTLFKIAPSTTTFASISASTTNSMPASGTAAKPSVIVGGTVPAMPKFQFGNSTKPVNALKQPSEKNLLPQESTKAPVFTFGGPKKDVNSPAPSLFGGNKLTVDNGLDVPSFGTATNPFNAIPAKPTETKPFAFKKPDNGEPASKVPTFSFGQSAGSAANPPATQAAGFNFGQGAKSPAFNFEANKNEKPAGSSAAANIFSSSNPTENSKNGIFNFGGSSQKPGFNFGAPAAPTSTGFNFGAGATTTPAAPSGGFNFSAAFDATAKPTFNFSGNSAPIAFSAQPQATVEGVPPRKIRKPVRRTQR